VTKDVNFVVEKPGLPGFFFCVFFMSLSALTDYSQLQSHGRDLLAKTSYESDR
jgi:hypothetical protein